MQTLNIDKIIKEEPLSKNKFDEKDERVPNPKFTTKEERDVQF